MNWAVAGAAAEVVGAIGVIVSLLYLAAQVRMQNRQARLDVVNELARQRNEYSGNVADNGALAEIWSRGIIDYEALSDIERVRFSAHLARMVRVMESLFQHRSEDQFRGENWEALDEYMKDVFSYAGVQQWWQLRARYFTKAFQAHVISHINAGHEPANFYGEEAAR